MAGKFITIEGPEGSGKSSVVKFLIKKFKENGINFLATKEPGSTLDPVCLELREFILNPKRKIDEDAEVFLYMADRCQHVNSVIRPALRENKIVLSDRYIDSSYAYQGWGRRGGTEDALNFIEFLNEKSTNNLVPDLTIILSVLPEIGFKRLTTKEFGKKDRIEQEDLEFFKRVYDGFFDIPKRYPNRNFYIIETDNITLESVCSKSWSIIKKEI